MLHPLLPKVTDRATSEDRTIGSGAVESGSRRTDMIEQSSVDAAARIDCMHPARLQYELNASFVGLHGVREGPLADLQG